LGGWGLVSEWVETSPAATEGLSCAEGERGSKQKIDFTVTWKLKTAIEILPAIGLLQFDLGLDVFGGTADIAWKKYSILVDCCCPKDSKRSAIGKIKVAKVMSWINPKTGLYDHVNMDHDGWPHNDPPRRPRPPATVGPRFR
jgi:hypothetical protein